MQRALTHKAAINGHDAYSGGSVPLMALSFTKLREGHDGPARFKEKSR